MKTNKIRQIAILTASLLLCACNSAQKQNPAYQIDLPEGCQTPDGMALGADGNIYLSINQLSGKFKNSGKIVRIDANDKISDFAVLPPSPETKVASPMGVCFGSDDNLYIADNQMFGGAKQGSRILRVKIKDGKALSCAPVVEGLMVANGIACAKDKIFLTDCMVDMRGNPIKSAVYVLDIAKLDEKNPVKVNGLNDPHVFDVISTRWTSPETQVGCDGICSDSEGNIYVANFGEASVSKYVFDNSSKILSKKIILKGKTKSCDGLHIDAENNLWISDFVGNAVAKLNLATGDFEVVKSSKVGTLPVNGELCAPADAIRRGDKLYISNMNTDMAPHKSLPAHTLSVVKLK